MGTAAVEISVDAAPKTEIEAPRDLAGPILGKYLKKLKPSYQGQLKGACVYFLKCNTVEVTIPRTMG